MPVWIALLVLMVLGGSVAGWYFGVKLPEDQRLAEIARLDAEGRTAEAMRLRNEAERNAVEAARIAALRGGVIVRTMPAGAEVQVGAEATGKTPLTVKSLKLGKYPVHIRMSGYDDWDGETQVTENEFAPVNVTLLR